MHDLGRQGAQLLSLNVLRKKLDFPDLKRAVRQQSDLFNPTTILIEDKASGTQLIQDLLDVGLSRVTRYKPDGDKIMRLHAQTATIENGFVRLPETAHWLADYLQELILFPAGRYDDQVDFDGAGVGMDENSTGRMGMAPIGRGRQAFAPECGSEFWPQNSVSQMRAGWAEGGDHPDGGAILELRLASRE